MTSKPGNIPFNKTNFWNLQQERNMLKITIDFWNNENDKLKSQIEDMQITVKHNKEQWEEYVTKITNKDKVFEKMNSQIEQLTARWRVLDKINKKKINMNPAVSTINNQNTTNANTWLNSSVIVTKDEKHLYNNKRNDERYKEFFYKQSEIFEEMNILKDDVQFLWENKSKSKLKEHLDQSMTSNRSSYSNNTSLMLGSNRNNNINESLSILNQSLVSNLSTNTVKKKINLQERFNFDKNLTEWWVNFNPKKNILLLVDNDNTVWELVKRVDIGVSHVKSNLDSIKSVIPNDYYRKYEKDNKHGTYDDKSWNQSEVDIEKEDFNISKVIKESDLL